METNVQSPRDVQTAVEAVGFGRGRRGSGCRHRGLRVAFDRRWVTVRTKAEPKADPEAEMLRGRLGRPGLWKMVVPQKPKRARREFHLPLAAIEGGDARADDRAEADDPLRACLDWAAATVEGDVPDGWTSPPREQVEAWIPSRGLVIQSGPLLRQGSLIHGPTRLALSFPLAGELSDEISPARRDWLGRVLADAQSRWRMVRVGMEGAPQRPEVRAEVDLTGAPHCVLEALVPIGLDAVRWVVSWSLWSVAFLTDARVTCRAWEAAQRKEDELS